MRQLNLEMQHGNPHGAFRKTHPIERPEGLDDDEYALHAKSAANLVARVLTGSPGDILRVTGVVIMVVEEGLLSEEDITEQLLLAANRHSRSQTWRDAHVIEPIVATTSATL